MAGRACLRCLGRRHGCGQRERHGVDSCGDGILGFQNHTCAVRETKPGPRQVGVTGHSAERSHRSSGEVEPFLGRGVGVRGGFHAGHVERPGPTDGSRVAGFDVPFPEEWFEWSGVLPEGAVEGLSPNTQKRPRWNTSRAATPVGRREYQLRAGDRQAGSRHALRSGFQGEDRRPGLSVRRRPRRIAQDERSRVGPMSSYPLDRHPGADPRPTPVHSSAFSLSV